MSLLIILSVVFSQLSMREGLSQNTVFSIDMDSERNIWLATYEGINRFDGYNFSVFYTEKDPGYVQEAGCDPFVFVDSRGRIWAFDGGLNLFDKKTESFVPYRGFLKGTISDIAESVDGKILVLSNGLIIEIDPDTGNSRTLGNDYLVSSIDCRFGLMALGTTDGRVLIYRVSDNSLIGSFMLDESAEHIKSVIVKSQSEIWAITHENGKVFRLDYRARSVNRYNIKAHLLVLGRDDNIYACIPSNIFKYDSSSGMFEGCADTDVFPHNVISLMIDNEGGLWMGTFRGGAYYTFPKQCPVSKLDLTEERKDLVVCSIFEGWDDSIWISTSDGLLRYDAAQGKAMGDPLENPILNDGVMTSFVDKHFHKMFFGNSYGITVYDYVQKAFSYILPSSGEEFKVYSFAREDQERFWVSTLSGLYLLNIRTSSLSKLPGTEHMFTYKILRDSAGYLWAATASGLLRAKILGSGSDGEMKCGQFERFSDATECHDIIKCGESIYVAARNGLFVYDERGEWSHFDASNGLSNQFLNGLESDAFGRIWIGSEDGLNMFDPSIKRFIRYYTEDGVGVSYFTKNAHYSAANGMIYFGGVDGVCQIHSNEDAPQLYSGKPFISAVFVNGKRQKLESGRLKLKYTENSLSFSFGVHNYSSRGRSIFYYQLEGQETSQRTSLEPVSILYSSLRPGKYCLHLSSANKNQQLSPSETILEITILPPWYASTVAKILYLLIITGLLVYSAFYLTRRNKRQIEYAVAQTREQSQAEIDKLRVQNLTGRILGPEDVKFVAQMIDIIEKNAANSSFGVDQLAAIMGISRSTLFLKIKDKLDDSASHIIRVIRFNEACRLLRETDKTIEEIAQETGYSSGASFSASFKKEKGISPNEWRK